MKIKSVLVKHSRSEIQLNSMLKSKYHNVCTYLVTDSYCCQSYHHQSYHHRYNCCHSYPSVIIWMFYRNTNSKMLDRNSKTYWIIVNINLWYFIFNYSLSFIVIWYLHQNYDFSLTYLIPMIKGKHFHLLLMVLIQWSSYMTHPISEDFKRIL